MWGGKGVTCKNNQKKTDINVNFIIPKADILENIPLMA